MSRSLKDIKDVNCKLYFICHKMSNVKKSNTLTMDDYGKMSNIKMSKDVKKSKRCQQTVNLYEVAWMGGVRWPGWEG